MDVGRKNLDIVQGMMQSKMKLKGDLATIVRFVKASTRLAEIASIVGGKFPDELMPEEVEKLRATVKDLGGRFLGIEV